MDFENKRLVVRAPLPVSKAIPPGAVAYHYTIGRTLRGIVRDGHIKPAVAGVPKGERPTVWFTVRDTFEPTACKLLMAPDGRTRSLSVEETAEVGGGLFRIGVSASELKTWDQWVRESGVSQLMLMGLVLSARKQGSEPGEWLVAFEAVGRSRWVSVESLRDGTWSGVNPDQF